MNLPQPPQLRSPQAQSRSVHPVGFAARLRQIWPRRRHHSRSGHRLVQSVLYGTAIALSWGFLTPSFAAERLTIRFGPLQRTVEIDDLEYFAETGDIPEGLALYTPLLTSDMRATLTSRLQIDPAVGDRLVNDLMQSSAGERLLNMLELVIPNSDREQLSVALSLAASQIDGVSLLGFLRAFPEETMIVDGTSAIALASQMNLPYWQSQALSSILERELTVETPEPFQSAFDPTTPGYETVRQQTFTFNDRDRDRLIPVDLYWSRNAPGPLIVISHGFGADRRFLNYLANHLASHGLTVAALEHPGSNVAWLNRFALGDSDQGALHDILPATEFVDRPQDVSFLLDQLERMSRYSNVLRDQINTDQVTVIGHSLGGYTALLLAGAELSLEHLQQFCNNRSVVGLSPADWLQCNAAELTEKPRSLRDPRVAQVIALNPVMGRLFDEASLAKVSVPTLVLAGTEDAITPAVSQQLLPFAHLGSANKYLLTVIGGTHLSVGDPTNLNHALTQSMFMRERRRYETEPLRHLMRGVTLAFVKQLTPEADLYAPFLTSAYVQSFSTDTLKTRFNSELPVNLSHWLTMAALPIEQLVAATLPKRKAGEAICGTALHGPSAECLISKLPLVMFMLPGELPLSANHFFRLKRRQRRKQDGRKLRLKRR